MIQRIASQDTTNSASANTVTATYPAVPAQNNTLIVVVGGNDGNTGNFLTNSGWSQVSGPATSTAELDIFYKRAGASEPTAIVANNAGTFIEIAIYEYQGIGLSPLDVSATNSNFPATTATTLSTGTTGTTSQANELAFVAAVAKSNTAFVSWDNSFNSRNNINSTFSLFTADRITIAKATYTSNLVVGTAATLGTMIVTFQASVTTFRPRPGLRPHPFSPGLAK